MNHLFYDTLKFVKIVFAITCLCSLSASMVALSLPPRPLVDGDLIGVLSISSRNNPATTDTAFVRGELAKLGFRTLFSEHLLDQTDLSFGASDSVRASEFMRMIDNDSVRAILFYRGGYGAVRVLDGIDWRWVKRHPKWIAGYSDITMIHQAFAARGIPTIHSDMPVSFDRDTTLTERVDTTAVSVSLRSLGEALRGHLKYIQVEPHALNQYGQAKGRITGGNLSLIYSASATPEDCAFRKKGYILFIEEVSEKLYHVDRMMQNLERSGKLAGASAIVVGHMTDIGQIDRFGVASAEELIARYTTKYKIPVIFGIPIGHSRPNLSIYLGLKARVDVDQSGARIEFL